MQLYWQGTDITESVNVTGCVIRDACGDRTDMLELKLDRAADWYRWAPEEDDEIILTDGVYTTGTMYLNAVIPEGDQYRVLATGTKRAAARNPSGYVTRSPTEAPLPPFPAQPFPHPNRSIWQRFRYLQQMPPLPSPSPPNSPDALRNLTCPIPPQPAVPARRSSVPN